MKTEKQIREEIEKLEAVALSETANGNTAFWHGGAHALKWVLDDRKEKKK